MKLSAYNQRLYNDIVEGNYENVAFRLMPQIESMLKYGKSPTQRRYMDEEIRQLAEIIKAGYAENKRRSDQHWAEQAAKYGF